MAESLDEIGTAVPFGAPGGLGPEDALLEIHAFPYGDQTANIEGERELVGRRHGTHRFPRHQKGIDRADVVVGDLGVVILGKRRIQMVPSGRRLAHCAEEGDFHQVRSGVGIVGLILAGDPEGVFRGRPPRTAAFAACDNDAVADRRECAPLPPPADRTTNPQCGFSRTDG